jgi:uncharacterized membrane protein YcaP (DUF421 family)
MMNGAHRMTQKGGIPFDEAAVVPLIACLPEGPRGRRGAAVGSHLDLVPAILDPEHDGPRGSARAPGDGALVCWDALHALDNRWAISGALQALTSMASDPSAVQDEHDRSAELKRAGERFGAPDFSKRTFFRAAVDGRYKLVRWFSPEEYGNPSTLEALYATGDVALDDLESDPGEMENLDDPRHPGHDRELVDALTSLLGLGLAPEELGGGQMALRAIAIYVYMLVLTRLGSKRILGKATAFDIILGIMIGSVMSRAINGSAAFVPTLVGGAVLIGAHRLFAIASYHTSWFGKLVKGEPLLLVRDGRVQPEGMRSASLTERDLEEAFRLRGIEPDAEHVERAYLERSGRISVIARKEPPHVVEVAVQDGGQVVRIVIE